MSQRIASSENQTMELATRVNPKGQTYLISPPREDQPTQPSPLAPLQAWQPQPTQVSQGGNLQGRFEIAVDALERAVDRLLHAPGSAAPTSSYTAPSGDTVPTSLPAPSEDLQGADAFQAAMDAFGGGEQVKDDIR